MKKAVKILVGILLAFAIAVAVIQKTTAGIIPLSDWVLQHPVETYFVKTTEENHEKLWTGNYRYVFNGYNAEGDEQQIVRVMDRELSPDAYLKMDTAGRYGKGWIEASEDEVPEEALLKLDKK